MAQAGFTVAVVDPSPTRGAMVEEGLRTAGVDRVFVVTDMDDLLQRLAALDPDAVVIDLESPTRDLLRQIFDTCRLLGRPVAIFVDRSDADMMRAAVEAGVASYVVDGLKPERVKPVIDVAILRFNLLSRLQRELSEAKSELADRKVIERAKGLIMRTRGVTEDEAYVLLRRTAMDQKRKLADIAQAVVTATDLLG